MLPFHGRLMTIICIGGDDVQDPFPGVSHVLQVIARYELPGPVPSALIIVVIEFQVPFGGGDPFDEPGILFSPDLQGIGTDELSPHIVLHIYIVKNTCMETKVMIQLFIVAASPGIFRAEAKVGLEFTQGASKGLGIIVLQPCNSEIRDGFERGTGLVMDVKATSSCDKSILDILIAEHALPLGGWCVRHWLRLRLGLGQDALFQISLFFLHTL